MGPDLDDRFGRHAVALAAETRAKAEAEENFQTARKTI
jgi:hypothetical protein